LFIYQVSRLILFLVDFVFQNVHIPIS
jgi:hypothetical protein